MTQNKPQKPASKACMSRKQPPDSKPVRSERGLRGHTVGGSRGDCFDAESLQKPVGHDMSTTHRKVAEPIIIQTVESFALIAQSSNIS
jgi:hypothetical protein